MKKIAFYFFPIVLLCLPTCKSMHETEPTELFQLKHTWPEVVAIAAKNGVDSTYIPYQKQSALMLLEEDDIAMVVKRQKLALDRRDQGNAFMANTYKVRNYSDYEALLSLYPLFEESYKKSFPSEEAYEEHRKRRLTGSWHIYRSPNGALGWIPAHIDHKPREGEVRIDTLPPVPIK